MCCEHISSFPLCRYDLDQSAGPTAWTTLSKKADRVLLTSISIVRSPFVSPALTLPISCTKSGTALLLFITHVLVSGISNSRSLHNLSRQTAAAGSRPVSIPAPSSHRVLMLRPSFMFTHLNEPLFCNRGFSIATRWHLRRGSHLPSKNRSAITAV